MLPKTEREDTLDPGDIGRLDWDDGAGDRDAVRFGFSCFSLDGASLLRRLDTALEAAAAALSAL